MRLANGLMAHTTLLSTMYDGHTSHIVHASSKSTFHTQTTTA